MLRSGVLMLAFIAATSYALPQIHNRHGDRVEELVKSAFQYVKYVYSKQDPLSMPDIKLDSKDSYLNGLIKADAAFTNLIYSGLSNINVNIIKTDPKHLTAQVQLQLPELKLAGKYEIKGEAVGQKVNGRGHNELRVLNTTASLNNLVMFETEQKALRIKSFGFDSDIADISLVADGLVVENMTLSDFEKLAGQSLLNVWESMRPQYNSVVESDNIRILNRGIGGRTLEQCIQWLKDNTPSHSPDNFITLPLMELSDN